MDTDIKYKAVAKSAEGYDLFLTEGHGFHYWSSLERKREMALFENLEELREALNSKETKYGYVSEEPLEVRIIKQTTITEEITEG